MRIHALWLSASIVALGWAGSAAAQDTSPADKEKASTQVEEVTVTAERRNTNLQTTPIAASVMSGADLEKKGITSVDALQFGTPGLVVNNFGQGIDFNIRGIGKAEHNSQTLTGVITYRDGVATHPGYFTGEPYFDISRVEILRGPQGTFVGENATGGAIFVNSQDPIIGGGHSGYIAGQVGNYSDVALQGALNLPISDTLAARIAFDTERRDSFYSITGPAIAQPDGLARGTVRASLLWKPTDALTVSLKATLNYNNYGGYFADPVLATNDPFHITANAPNQAFDRFGRVSLKVDYVLGNGITLRSVSGYQYGNTRYKTDLDGTSIGNNTFGDSVNERIWSQEINIISPDTGRFSWIVGAYLQDDELTFPFGTFYIGTPPGAVGTEYRLWGTNPKETKAVFGQITFDITDKLQFQAGARYSDNRTANHVRVLQYSAIPIIDEQAETYKSTSWKVGLNYTVNDHHFLYGFVARGYRPGGLNVPVGLGLPAPFDKEEVTEYELGWKAGFFGGHLRTQADVYYNDYRNFQVIIGYPAFPTFGFELNNPNPTKMYGAEIQAEAVFGKFSADVGMAWLHSELGTFFAVDPRAGSFVACNPATGPGSASCINLGGRQQTYAPNFTFNVGAQYIFDLPNGDTITPRLNFGHVSKQWATLFENPARGDRIGERNIFGGQLSWRHGDLVTTLYSTNLTDEQYVGALNSGLRFEGPPRQYGIRLLKAF